MLEHHARSVLLMTARDTKPDEDRRKRRAPSVIGGLLLLTSVAALSLWGRARHRDAVEASESIRVTARPIPDLATAARVEVDAAGALGVVVRYGRDTNYGSETPRFAVPAAGKLSVTIVGLAPGATTHIQVVAHLEGGRVRASNDETVLTAPLSATVPKGFPVRGAGPTNPVLLAMNQTKSAFGLAVIVDRSGRVLWYRQTPSGPNALERLPTGRILQPRGEMKGFDEIELDGTVVRTFRDDKSVGGTDGHDIRPLPNGNALVFGGEGHTVDSRPFFPGGTEHALRWDDTVSEVTAHGDVIWRWSSYAHVFESEITPYAAEPFNPKDYEVVHANSIEPTPDGNLLLSFRDTSTVAKIDRRSGDIVWRLGGKRSDFRFEGDPLGSFNRQHDARLVAADRILLFDNGNLHEPEESRAAEYRLDESAKTATLVWQFRHAPPLFAKVAGSAQRLPNGHTLISWGPRGVVTEVAMDGTVVWELETPGFGVFRARAIPGIYP